MLLAGIQLSANFVFIAFYTINDEMLFSDTAHTFDQPPNRLYTLRAALEKSGKRVHDLLTAQSQGKTYHPHPLGQKNAREAISDYYRGRGLIVSADHLVLTPGTSLSYWYAFKLLANPGDEILCPKPSYPLFESIAALAGLHLTSYPLIARARWDIDLTALERAITPRTRAIVLISPHNPTGAVATADEIHALSRIAQKHDLPVIVDEVFNAFVYSPEHRARINAPLVITLNGFSKMFGLPGLKLGWMAITGEKEPVHSAMKALEMISDTFLPVNETVQASVPKIFKSAKTRTRTIFHSAAKARHLCIRELSSVPGVSWNVPEGGFYGVLWLHGLNEESVTLKLLENGFLTHPGYFYDVEGSALVFNFHQRPATLKRFFRLLRLLKGFSQSNEHVS